MSEQHVKIRLTHDVYDGGAVLEVDGRDIAGQVRSVTVTAGVGQKTEVALELAVFEVDGMATVSMSNATRRLLLAYGWTPPAGSGATTAVDA